MHVDRWGRERVKFFVIAMWVVVEVREERAHGADDDEAQRGEITRRRGRTFNLVK
jgi:hypothetical protein